MPFAPVVLYDFKDKYFRNTKGVEETALYMTITLDATDYLKKQCPAIVHVDGTARPQLLKKKTNPFYYQILDEYRRITSQSVLINTSFNMHNEPIVYTPEDAIKTFLASRLDYLVMENFLIFQKK